MENLDKGNIDILLCKKCLTEISFGESYYSIVRNLESFCKDPETNETEIEIEDSEEIMILCKVCGSNFNSKALETILEHLPIPGQENRN